MLTIFDIDRVEMQRYIEKKMLGMKNHFDISDGIEIREVNIAGAVVVVLLFYGPSTYFRLFPARSVNLATLLLGKPLRQFTST